MTKLPGVMILPVFIYLLFSVLLFPTEMLQVFNLVAFVAMVGMKGHHLVEEIKV